MKKKIDPFFDIFLEDAVEANNCYFGGGGQNDHLTGVIELGRKIDPLDERLSKITQWFDSNGVVEKNYIGSLCDVWYDFFDELDTIEEKI